MRGTLRGLLIAVVAAVGAISVPATGEAAGPPPGAEAGISSFVTEVHDGTGADETRAGAHPLSARAQFKLNSYSSGIFGRDMRPVEDPKTIVVKLPRGFVGNAQNAAQCPLSLVPRQAFQPMQCPDDTVVGYVFVEGAVRLSTPIVNVVPEHGYPAEFAFSEVLQTYTLYPELRSDGDYGIDMVVPYANNDAITGVDATFCSYGVESNLSLIGGESTFRCLQPGEPKAYAKPLLTNPATECTDQAPFTDLEIDTYAHPGVFAKARAASPRITSCDTLSFSPSVNIAPTTSAADSPTGLDVNMTFPWEDNAQGQAPPALKKAVVTLPEGMTINPAGATGLAACTDAELNLKSKAPVRCPDAAKVATATATSPLLDEPVSGAVYIRSQNSSDPESGEMYRIGLVLENAARGISIRLPGQIRADRNSGRLVTTFDDNPELPVSNIDLRFKDGATAPLVTPASCGPKSIDTELASWGGQTVQRRSGFGVDCRPGLGGFQPSFSAGTAEPVAGAYSPLTIRVGRSDGEGEINRLEFTLPAGLTGKLAGVPYCPDEALAAAEGRSGAAETASPSCPSASRIGTVEATAGAGSSPYRVSGRAYLAGPYKGAPISAAVVTPAVAGPFDLGNVVVRSPLYVDPETARISAKSDPIPTVFGGVPLRLRSLLIKIDHPGFSLNPTSCEAMAVTATLGSSAGATASPSNRFQVGGCDALAFQPRLNLWLKGTGKRARKKSGKLRISGQMKRGGNPALRAVVTMPEGGANVARASVALPHSAFLDQSHIRTICTRVQFAAGNGHGSNCPKGSIYGHVTATSPLLDYTLEGNVYLRSSDHPLPDMVPVLEGPASQPIAIALVGRIDSKNGGIRTTFEGVPDAPVSRFVLDMQGGRKGLIVNSRNLCRSKVRSTAVFDGQNGKRTTTRPVVRPQCPKRAKAVHKKKRGHSQKRK